MSKYQVDANLVDQHSYMDSYQPDSTGVPVLYLVVAAVAAYVVVKPIIRKLRSRRRRPSWLWNSNTPEFAQSAQSAHSSPSGSGDLPQTRPTIDPKALYDYDYDYDYDVEKGAATMVPELTYSPDSESPDSFPGSPKFIVDRAIDPKPTPKFHSALFQGPEFDVIKIH